MIFDEILSDIEKGASYLKEVFPLLDFEQMSGFFVYPVPDKKLVVSLYNIIQSLYGNKPFDPKKRTNKHIDIIDILFGYDNVPAVGVILDDLGLRFFERDEISPKGEGYLGFDNITGRNLGIPESGEMVEVFVDFLRKNKGVWNQPFIDLFILQEYIYQGTLRLLYGVVLKSLELTDKYGYLLDQNIQNTIIYSEMNTSDPEIKELLQRYQKK